MNYKEVNRIAWNNKTQLHFESAFYDVDSFISGRNSLNEPELNLLGNVEGKKILHLQCHFGQDSISLARMGAEVTGVDLSDASIQKAIELNSRANTSVRFIRSDVYDLVDILDEKFDIVFTSYGAIPWLPDLSKWATLIRQFLKKGGQFVMAEFHPVVWMFDDQFIQLVHSYFNKKAIVEENSESYTDGKMIKKHTEICWNHSLDEVLGALLNQGLKINRFAEYDFSPYDCFSNTVKIKNGRYQIENLQGIIPLVYTLSCLKE